MTNINSEKIYKAVKELCQIVNNNLPKEEYLALKQLYLNEQNTQAKSALKQILQNAQIAAAEKRPLCQDTGFVTIFLNIGQNILITGENISQTINNAVKDGSFFKNESLINAVNHAKENNSSTMFPNTASALPKRRIITNKRGRAIKIPKIMYFILLSGLFCVSFFSLL